MHNDLKYWLIPIACFVIVGAFIFPYLLHTKYAVVYPNAAIELDELKNMNCEDITLRNGLGSYWTPSNGEFARDKVDDCKKVKEAYLAKLNDIRRVGTHEEKLEIGFTKLWFGVYDHPDLPFSKKTALVQIQPGTIDDNSLFPKELLVIIGYNNTLKFENLDDTGYYFTENYGKWSTPLLFPNDTSTVTVNEAGTYGYYAKPWLTGTLTVLEP